MASVSIAPEKSAANRLPRLETGDHLDQPTFHERYEAMPQNFRAELVGGVVYVPSPLMTPHAQHHALIMHWLGEFQLHTPGTTVLDNATVILGFESEPQPDATLVIDPASGGQTRIDEQGYLHGPPELVVEVASSSEAYDTHEKLRDYERAGVPEYVVVLLRDRAVRWMVLRDERFEDVPAPSDGILRSRTMPGLWLDTSALLARDSRILIETLRKGMATAEHAAFVGRLSGQ